MTPKLKALIYSHGKIAAAYYFAAGAHYGMDQLRPTLEDPSVPYIVHPVEVAGLVADVEWATAEMICAALLHDVVEDTAVKQSTIRELFGDVVATLVYELTDYFTANNFPGLNRETRKKMEVQRLATISDAAKTIKLADGLSNTPSIAINKPKFMPTYGPEKRAAWHALDGGDLRLWLRLDAELSRWGY